MDDNEKGKIKIKVSLPVSSAGKAEPPSPTSIPPQHDFKPLEASQSSQTFFPTHKITHGVIFLYFLQRSVMHRMFQMHFDRLISIFLISEHQVKKYKCLFSRWGNAVVQMQQLLGDGAHA